MNLATLNQRIQDRLSSDWLTPSQKVVWKQLHDFDGPPHRIINIYGMRGSGKSFLGWLMQRERYATYGLWSTQPTPTHPRLVLDNAPTDRASTREIRPLTEQLNVSQIILLSRQRVDEQAMPAFPLQVTKDDMECFRANLYRYLNLIVPEETESRDYRSALEAYLRKEL